MKASSDILNSLNRGMHSLPAVCCHSGSFQICTKRSNILWRLLWPKPARCASRRTYGQKLIPQKHLLVYLRIGFPRSGIGNLWSWVVSNLGASILLKLYRWNLRVCSQTGKWQRIRVTSLFVTTNNDVTCDIRDMVKAFGSAEILSLGCTLHTLQLGQKKQEAHHQVGLGKTHAAFMHFWDSIVAFRPSPLPRTTH